MATKKFVNNVDDAVSESLSGLCCAYPRLNYHASKRVVLQSNWHDRGQKVAVICGGGSGHEPFAAGFVGSGMLTAASSGSVFAAPPPDHILYAIRRVLAGNANAGVLVVIPNYTGDRLNFGIAIEEAKRAGLKVCDAIVGDDCSIPIAEQGRAGKRGLVGILFVNKVAGSLAQRDKSLEEIVSAVKTVTENIATYGVGLTPCSMPGEAPMFEIPSDEIEIGLGVHGEAGYERIKWREASKIVEILLERIIKILGLVSGNSVAVIVNNFGSSSQLEQSIVVHEVVKQLKSRKISPLRVYSGLLMTSLDSSGMHVSILRLLDDKRAFLLECLDDETDAPCWPGTRYSLPPERPEIEIEEMSEKVAPNIGKKFNAEQALIMKKCLKRACEKIIENKDKINALDRGCGDGDCGSMHSNLANSILSRLDGLNIYHPASLLVELSWIAEERMGGTSGAIYSLMFKAGASELAKGQNDDEWPRVWSRLSKYAIETVMRYSNARPGDRTMLDALIPASEAMDANLSRPLRDAMESARRAAWSGCQATKNMKPMTGRASYVKQAEFLGNVDAGSFAVATWIDAIAEQIAKHQ